MTPPVRAAVSGRDYQLRYALWRLTRMAVGRTERPGEAAMRVEWPVALGGVEQLFVDVLIETEDGRPLEIVECKEHRLFVEIDSVAEFLRNAQRIVSSGAVPDDTLFRFVSTGQLVRHGRPREMDISRAEGRALLLGELVPEDCRRIARELAPRLRWQIGHAVKEHLSSDTLLEMSWHIAEREKLLGLYFASFVRLAAQQAYRRPEERDEIEQALFDVHIYLFSRRNAGGRRQRLDRRRGRGRCRTAGGIRRPLHPRHRRRPLLRRQRRRDARLRHGG